MDLWPQSATVITRYWGSSGHTSFDIRRRRALCSDIACHCKKQEKQGARHDALRTEYTELGWDTKLEQQQDRSYLLFTHSKTTP